MRTRFGPLQVVLWVLVASASVFAQPELHLKSRMYGRDRIVREERAARSVSGERRHWLIQFGERPTIDDTEALRIRGARIVGPAPEWGFVISAEPDLDLGGLNLARVERIAVSDKLSPELSTAQAGGEVAAGTRVRAREAAGSFIVEFHTDVAPSAARQILLESQVRVVEHSQLLDQHYVVEAKRSQLEQLAEWDEVAYIFPASDDLGIGSPVNVCFGAVTENGAVGQSVAIVGPGWAPGKGEARLNYTLGALTQKLDSARLKQELHRALGEWSKYVQVDFSESNSLAAKQTLAFRWGRGASGGPLPFDGPGKMLAYTYYPAPPNPEPAAGDLYFDDDENWQVGADIDLFSVILHEVGHALGLGHSDKPGAVMYPYYRRTSGLTEEDIGAVRTLYAARSLDLPLTPQPADPLPSTPSNSPAVPPTTPATPPSQPAPAPPALPTPSDRTPPVLAITSPVAKTVTTAQPVISIVGTASDSSGLADVSWANTTGGFGAAQGTSRWRADVPLVRGVNAVVIQARDTAGNVSWRSVIVTRR